MKSFTAHVSDPDRTDTWLRFHKDLCEQCQACCCAMPVEVWLSDLIQMGLVDSFEAEEAPRQIAKRLQQARIISQYNHSSGIFVLARRANGDCLYLDKDSRRCTIYEKRPRTCRNHPQKGPKPGYCAFKPKQTRP